MKELQFTKTTVRKRCVDNERAYAMLRRLDGDHACRVLDFDGTWLTMERIIPGDTLRTVAEPEQRLGIFAEVIHAIHRPVEAGESYLDWLTAARRKAPANWRHRADRALSIGRAFFDAYPERLLLHGDLHHDNILRHSDGSWVIIDPKAVVAPAIFDLPRFLLNDQDRAVLIPRFAEVFGYPEDHIRAAFLMEVTLANLWSMEDGAAPDLTLQAWAESEIQPT